MSRAAGPGTPCLGSASQGLLFNPNCRKRPRCSMLDSCCRMGSRVLPDPATRKRSFLRFQSLRYLRSSVFRRQKRAVAATKTRRLVRADQFIPFALSCAYSGHILGFSREAPDAPAHATWQFADIRAALDRMARLLQSRLEAGLLLGLQGALK